MRPVPLSLWAGTWPPRAHLTRVRGLTFRCAAASEAVSHSDWGETLISKWARRRLKCLKSSRNQPKSRLTLPFYCHTFAFSLPLRVKPSATGTGIASILRIRPPYPSPVLFLEDHASNSNQKRLCKLFNCAPVGRSSLEISTALPAFCNGVTL